MKRLQCSSIAFVAASFFVVSCSSDDPSNNEQNTAGADADVQQTDAASVSGETDAQTSDPNSDAQVGSSVDAAATVADAASRMDASVHMMPLDGSVMSSDAKAAMKGCYVTGCSGQLCSSDPNVRTTCEWRPEYECYKSATCERQNDGKCGWTQTTELKQCLE